MKRVFAFISLFAIALVMFGFGTSNVNAAEAADGKWFENPHLLKDEQGNVVEIPMYIMNSITTTFPDYFDYEGAKGTEFEDKEWGGVTRSYAWNGVKVVIPEFNENGATGKFYGIYEQGASGAGKIGIGNMIYTTSGVWENGTFFKETNRTSAADPSLDFFLMNDKEEAYSLATSGINTTNVADPYTIFDADGKAVAGMIFPDDTGSGVVQVELATEFCYDENGVGVVANADASNCAKVMIDGEEDDLNNPVLDDEGNPTGEYYPVKVPGDDPQYITDRFVWAYMEEAPANLNGNYLGEGWKADNWDFYNEETGIAVAFLSTYFANAGKVTAAQVEADGTIDANHIRAPFNELAIPAGGFMYKVGYLNRGNAGYIALYKQVQAQAYLYGRDENYAQTLQCYNYAASDVAFQEANAVVGDANIGLTLIDGHTVQVPAGSTIDFKQLINVNGIANCFKDLSDPTSFASSIMTEDQLAAKLAEFVEAEKAIMREEVAYEVYQKQLDEWKSEEAQLKAAIDEAKATLDNAKKTLEGIYDAAEKSILASEDTDIVDDYKALQNAIKNVEAQIEDKKAEIIDAKKAVEVAQAEYDKSQVSYKDTIQYKGYNSSLTDAKAAHDSALAIVKSFVALTLGNEGIETEDVAVTATQDKIYEDWDIEFANADIEAAENAFIAAIHAESGIAEARAALVATFKAVKGDVFEEDYLAVVNAYVDTLVKLDIANVAMHDYIADCLSKTTDKAKALADAKDELADLEAELGAPKTDKDPATGLYEDLEKAEADRIKYIDEYMSKDPDYLAAKKAVEDAEKALAEAKEKLGAPSTDETEATGFYAKSEPAIAKIEAKIEEEATARAKVAYANWLETEYANNIALEYTVTVDGKKLVYKNETPYETKDDMVEDFLKDWATWAEANGIAKVNDEYGFGSVINDSVTAFYADEAINAKWSWILEYLVANCTESGNLEPLQLALKGYTEKWYNTTRTGVEIAAFMLGDKFNSELQAELGIPAGWMPGSTDYRTVANGGTLETEAKATQFMPAAFDAFELNIPEAIDAQTQVEVKVYNPILDQEFSMNLTFEAVIDEYDVRPLIEINDKALYVTDPTTFDVRDIATAYNKVYSAANGFKGSDISTQIEFICPELDAALENGVVSGEFKVEMLVDNMYGRHAERKTTVVKFVDGTAPILLARDITVEYGADFYFLDGIYFAYDNVEGNLFESDSFLFAVVEDTVVTTKPGEYKVVVSAMDKSGNSTEVEYFVFVNENPVDDFNAKVDEAVENLESAVKDTQEALDGAIADTNNALQGEIDNVNGAVEEVNKAANDKSLVVVATVLAGVAAAASIGAVVLVILKRK